ncbi:similar to Saccharomyces cerevisiae YPL180W TCO89 Subunit of TORC1 (Tor1p or Tor2p-Kog1p-Lst8p-Tco89p), a complex that regulates growth in response to nutrient availability [Maudiozyma saulgeensis]|uniref:Similar to Saccharomyces cerevisiae YPL180W TCO89 Subunit of TORC1 (Tor1p or Tor2p-Kog1p-Lst8p-Tco89p), a complex that regulates growth in response to nutrient availability n=1 Tax=Maudiozyma saulgeensis TaxID=1789683 RepID=A0A1X7RAB9_9SACH|nr:similar to Saccharomyces cerevisiae YPL180W TCO89 Subunit of TORC1 (Tor1p or Tor2p-Kog1p-Lst8p-Tco89p), a complex that regulates growth in response to nutrient availability [Kazachstania saulgeensis]
MGRKIKIEPTQLASPTGIQLGPSQFIHGQNNKPPTRQFTTRSRAKSTASFKGLRKVLTHDGTTIDRDSMKPTKSSDALFRKRAISGLNMTALARVRSNPNVHGGSGSHGHGTGMWMGIPGIKPRRTKSTHSVISMKDNSDSCSNSEEELVTDSESDTVVKDLRRDNKQSKNSNNGSGMIRDNSREKLISIDSIIEEAQMDSRTEDLLADKEHVVKPLSYKPPSDYINHGNTGVSQDKLNDSSQNDTSLELEIKASGFSNVDKTVNGMSKNNNVTTTNNNEDDVLKKNAELSISNDHIEPADISDNNEGYDLYRNQLTRQTKSKEHETNIDTKQSIPVQNNGNADIRNGQKNSELNDQYIPNMILSQSTGVVRHFDDPPSIQNSLANEIHANRNSGYSISNNHNIDQETFKTSQLLNSREPKSSIHQVPKELANKINGFNTNEDTIHHNNNSDISGNVQNSKISNFSNSYSSLTNNLQRANAAAVLGKTASARVPQSPHRPNTGTNSQTGSTPLSSLFRKKGNQYELSGSNDAKKEGGETTKGGDGKKLNNFSQFLKSDMTEGDSRTQRKLWLQRENSIMDLNIQNGSVDSVFMVTNVDVKREFERISHEYTNSKRFYNPLDAALKRFETYKKQQEDTNRVNEVNSKTKSKSKSTNNKLSGHLSLRSTESNNTEFFANYGSSQSNTVNMEEFQPTVQNSKLQRVLSSIWKEESMAFNNEMNQLNKGNKSYHQRELSDGSQHRLSQAGNAGSRSIYNNSYLNSGINQSGNNRQSLRNAPINNNYGSQSRMMNSLQPTTRAVIRRNESSSQHIQRF